MTLDNIRPSASIGSGSQIDAFIRSYREITSAPLYVTPDFAQHLLRSMANIEGLVKEGALVVKSKA